MDIETVRKNLEMLHQKCVKKYDITKQHFNVGDRAWICTYDGELVSVIIEEIESFKKEENDGGCVYYCFRFENIKKSELIWESIKLYIWYIKHFGIKGLKYASKPGYGHSEMVGRNEVLFKDKKECYADYLFNYLYDKLDELEEHINTH
ncbi:MAG: hypothetical protein ACOCQD_01230 [archaeon]